MSSVAVSTSNLGVVVNRSSLLRGVELRAGSGEWLSVIGPNGAGKSTLLRAIAGVVASTGRLELLGENAADLSKRDRSRLVSWVPQSPTLPAGIAVFDYVLLGRTPHLHPLAREKRSDLEITERVLDELDLTELASRRVDTLSGGELQRAVIGRALAQQAPIVLLDEPTSALDLGHQQEVLTLLDRLRTGGARTIITTMHDLTLAGVFADRLVLLSDGAIVAEGAAHQVLTEANLERYYGARVTVTDHQGQILVTPRLAGPGTESPR